MGHSCQSPWLAQAYSTRQERLSGVLLNRNQGIGELTGGADFT
jgi:hypothetical protein